MFTFDKARSTIIKDAQLYHKHVLHPITVQKKETTEHYNKATFEQLITSLMFQVSFLSV